MTRALDSGIDRIQALLVTAGRIAFVGLWFLAVLMIYAGLGRDAEGLRQAGLFAVAIVSVKLVSGFLSDPVDLALMRRVPLLLQGSRPAAYAVIRTAFGMRMGAACAIASLLMLAAPWVAAGVLGQPGAAALVRITALCIVGDVLFRAVLVVFQASARFRAFLLIEALLQIGRFGAITALWGLGAIQVGHVMASYAAASFVAAAAGLALLPPGLVRSVRMKWRHAREMLSYLKWMMPAMLLAAVNERLDVMLLYWLHGPDQAGLYGAVLTLALVPDIVGGCLSLVLQPHIAALHSGREFMRSLRRFLVVSVPMCALGFLAAALLADWVIPLLLGPRYAPAVPAFRWLLGGTLFWLAVTPLPMTLVAVLAPDRIALVTLGQSAIVMTGGVLLAPALGLTGMAQAICVMRVVIALVLAGLASGMAVPQRGGLAVQS